MTDRYSDRRDAEVLQEALERHQDLLAKGVAGPKARARIASELPGPASALFALAAGMGDAAAPVPAPSEQFTERLAARLGATGKVEQLRPRRRLIAWRLPGLGIAAAAAAIAIFAGLLVPAFRSLPGDPLYALKRGSENARVAIVSGSTEAQLRMRIAGERYEEVEALVERAQLAEVGPGLAAASIVEDISDPELIELIQDTLADAEEQIHAAAAILISEPTDVQALNDLVVISQRGRQLVQEIADDVPAIDKPPVMSTVVSLAKIEAEAKAAKMVAEQSAEQQPQPALQPCDTPTPEPTDASPQPTGTDEPSATPTALTTPEPTITPEPTPCLSPSPTPTPSPTATPTPTPQQVSETPTQPSPTAQPQGEPADDNRSAERWWEAPSEGSSGSPSGA
jgi:hypothetical protein